MPVKFVYAESDYLTHFRTVDLVRGLFSSGKIERFSLCMSLFSATETDFFCANEQSRHGISDEQRGCSLSENGGNYATDQKFKHYP